MVCGLENGHLEKIADCTPNQLEYVISIVFGVTYVEDLEDWGLVPMVTHIVWVQHVNWDVYQLVSQLVLIGIEDDIGVMPIGMVINGRWSLWLQ